jgi:hypothetical protein
MGYPFEHNVIAGKNQKGIRKTFGYLVKPPASPIPIKIGPSREARPAP